MMVGLAVTGAALTLALSGRRIYQTDQNRTSLNQNLRAGLDLLGIDVRQAGERIPADFPAIEIVNGTGGGADTLVLRRNLLDAVLPVCGDITAGSTTAQLVVGDRNPSPPAGCDPVLDQDADGWPDNLGAWRAYRQAGGGAILAYVYNPVGQYGEYFTYDSEDSANLRLHKGNGDAWANSYGVSEGCRVYVVEQRTFRLNGGLLQLLMNGDTATPLNLVCDVTGFQARAHMQDGSVLDTLDATTSWPGLEALEVTLSGQVTFQGRVLNRSLSARYFPRNVLSR